MGKKSAPKTPDPPDPRVVADSQTQSNLETALATAALNRVNVNSPYGTVRYTQSPTNPLSYTQSINLSPEQQQQLNNQYAVGNATTDLALQNFGQVSAAQAQPFDLGGLSPALTTGVNTQQLQYGPTQAGQIQTGVGDAGPLASGVSDAGAINSNIQNTGVNTATPTAQLNTAGVNPGQLATALGASPQYQTNVDISGVQGIPGLGDFAGERQRIEDQFYGQQSGRINEEYDRQQALLENKLRNQGLTTGSEAWDWEMKRLGDNRNRALEDARLSSSQFAAGEQGRLFNQAMGARQQGVGEQFQLGDFYNTAAGNIFGQNLARAGFGNQAIAQQYGLNAGEMDRLNNVLAQQYGIDLNSFNAGNQALGQQFGQNLAAGQFGNQAQQQQYGQNLSNAQFQNQAQQQLFAQLLGLGDFANRAQQQQYTQNMGDAQFYNTAAAQDLQQQLQAGAFGNQARTQDLQEQSYVRNLPINELAALLGAAPGIQLPQGQAYGAANVNPTDIAGIYQNNFNNQMSAYNAQQQAKGGKLGGMGGMLGGVVGLL